MPVHDPPCNALKPCKGTLVEPVTNCRRRPLLSSLKASTACQNHRTTLLSLVQCFRRVFVFQSARSIFPSPPMINWQRERRIKERVVDHDKYNLVLCLASSVHSKYTFLFTDSTCTSSSLWSKGLRRCWGMSSLNPFCRARNWASIPRINLQFT